MGARQPFAIQLLSSLGTSIQKLPRHSHLERTILHLAGRPAPIFVLYVERLRAAGRDVELTEYPSASHAFDNPLGAQPAAVSPKFESSRNCKIREEADGLLINADTKQQFTYRDACVVHGPHLGYDPVATQAAKTSVNAFLQTVFKLQ